MWNFEKIPSSVIPEVLAAWDTGNLRHLMKIYNTYKVAPDVLTGCCGGEKVRLWTLWAIRENKFNR